MQSTLRINNSFRSYVVMVIGRYMGYSEKSIDYENEKKTYRKQFL